MCRYGTGYEGFYGHIWMVHQDYPDMPLWVTEYANMSEDDGGKLHSQKYPLKPALIFLRSLQLHEGHNGLHGHAPLDPEIRVVRFFRESSPVPRILAIHSSWSTNHSTQHLVSTTVCVTYRILEAT